MPTLMVQGTTSDAGKSILVAGLCRLLARKSVKVAPFKPQNMALNSAVTEDGGEIGRSQAVQAQACFLAPHTDMNPVLLKPSSDTGAQIIIQGKALSSMEAAAYHDYKTTAMKAVLDSYQRLQNQYDVVVVEGAGSPAEINLRDRDIANMGFAEEVDCPVILIADIDRGGVFAHLIGTLQLLSSSEQKRVVGFVINRFRGDIALLQKGLDWLEERTGKPVLAVLPYLPDFYLDAEDAIATEQARTAEQQLNIVVPIFPRISNHTDFDALRLNENLNVKMVSLQQPMPACDLLILPGSKNVRHDLKMLKQCGWVEQIKKHLRYGGKVLGVCGGLQMLGEYIHDPDGIEDVAGSEAGLGLLPINTTFKQEKKLSQFSGWLNNQALNVATPIPFQGYEIHCGESTFSQKLTPLGHYSNGAPEGCISDDGSIIASYVHGLFDNAETTNALLNWAGLVADESAVSLGDVREQQLNRLADVLEAHFTSDFIATLCQS